MVIDSLLKKRNMTKYRLAVEAGIPHATLNDICSGKTKLESVFMSESIWMILRCSLTMHRIFPNCKRNFTRNILQQELI